MPPLAALDRRPRGAFVWLEAELPHDDWLAEIEPNGVATLVLLALAADRRGASFFCRERMAIAIGISSHELDVALQGLLDNGLVDHRPWSIGARDGVWQLLPPPPRRQPERALRELSAAEVLRNLGFGPR